MDAGRVSRVIFVFSNSSLLCVFLAYASLSGSLTFRAFFAQKKTVHGTNVTNLM